MSEKISIIIIILVTIFLILIFGAFCYSIYQYADYGIKQGIIVDKQYESAYTYTAYTTSYIGNDTIRIPHQEYVSEKYKIKIQKTEDNKIKSIWLEVTSEEYNTLNIGDSYGGYLEE